MKTYTVTHKRDLKPRTVIASNKHGAITTAMSADQASSPKYTFARKTYTAVEVVQ